MATNCNFDVKDAKTGETRKCKLAPLQGSEFCKRHGGAPKAAPAPSAPAPAQAAAAAPVAAAAGTCTAIVKKTNTPCKNKAKVGNLCGMHAPKAAKAAPVSTDGSGYPTNCKKTTGKHVACKNSAYGPDAAGVASCSRHGGPKKPTSAGAPAASGGHAAPANGIGNIPLLHIAAVVGDHLLKQLDPEVAAENAKNGFSAEFEAANWLVEWFRLFDGKNPSDKEILLQLKCLAYTADDEDFLERFSGEGEETSHSMVYYLAQLLGDANITWLVNYIRKYSNMSLDGLEEELQEYWEQVKTEMGFSDVQEPIANEKPVAGNAGKSNIAQFSKIKDRMMARVNEKLEKKVEEEEKEEAEDLMA